MIRRLPLLLALLLPLVGAAPRAEANWHATGRFFYRDREQDLTGFTGIQIDKPARRVDVQVLDNTTSAVLASGATGLDGSYDLLVVDAVVRDVRVRFLTSTASTAGLFASVRRSASNPQIYSVTSATIPGHNPNVAVSFGDLTALPASGGEPFNLFNVILNGLDYVKVLHGSWPAVGVLVYWDAASTDGTYFQPSDNTIHLTGAEGYDDAVVGHEQGHFVAANFSKDQNPGGAHFLGDNNQDIRLSWSEGWATYFECSVRRRLGVTNPGITYYITTTGAPGPGNLDFSYELEGPGVGAVGAASEVSVQALLWDIADNALTLDDSPGTDDDAIVDRADEDTWEVMRNYLQQPGVNNVSLEDFWDGWFRPAQTHDRIAEMTAAFDALSVEFHDDSFENDDAIGSAAAAPADGSPQHRSFYPAGDSDFSWFAGTAGQAYLVETTDLISDGNTTLSVLDSTGFVLATNDDRAPGDASSRIVFTPGASARYFARVQHAPDLGVYGSYNLRVFQGSASAVTFTDVGSASGTNNSGSSRGVSWADYDGDGWLDLYVCNIGSANALYRNQQNGTFVDRAATAGVAMATSSEGVCFGDYDNDGDLDLYVATVGTDDALFQNRLVETGTPTFLNVTVAAGITDAGSGRTPSWVDFDHDGDLDLFVANVATGPSKLWSNDGDGTFTDVSTIAGLGVSGAITAPWVDFDRDGDDDVFMGVNGGPSKLFRNDSGTFVDVTATAGTVGGPSTFGADWGDFDGDGWPDLTIADSEGPNLLYRNLGNGTFSEVGVERGAASPLQSVASTFGDHDLDGDLDLYVANFNSANQLFDNITGRAFTATSAANLLARSRSAAWGDYDRDGDPDLYVPTEAANSLFRNNAPARPWLEIDLFGRNSNRYGIGSRITASAAGRRQVRWVEAGMGFGTQNSLRANFGFGPGVVTVDTVMVDWPSRKRTLMTNVAVNQILLIDESTAVAVSDSPPRAGLLFAGARPNPAAGPLTLELEIPAALGGSRASLEVFAPDGRRVRQVFEGPLGAGPHRLAWDLRDARGARVTAGVYLAVLRVGSESRVRKIALLPALR